MPGQKRKYSVRFPPSRVKKIMQKDAEVGRMSTAVPVLISRALEMFLKSLLTQTCVITRSKMSSVMSLSHLKQCIESEKLFHFLEGVAERTTPVNSQRDARGLGMWPLFRSKQQKNVVNVKEISTRPKAPGTNDSSASESELFICL